VHRRLEFDDGEVLIERRVAASDKHFMLQRWPDGGGPPASTQPTRRGVGRPRSWPSEETSARSKGGE
jgi:two-component sensor histidine kinase